MKKQDLSQELVQKTVAALDEVENEVLGVQTGVKAGVDLCKNPDSCPRPLYGLPPS